jgi:Flp pilus assembly protein TadD
VNTQARSGRKASILAVGALLAAAVAGCASQPSPEALAVQGLLAAGENAESRGDYDAALVQYVKVFSAEPDNTEAHYRIGRVHAALGNNVTASEAYQRVLAKTPAHVGALEGLGLLYLEGGQRDVAASMLHKALGKDAARWRSYNGLGILADLAGRHVLAQAYFGAALKLRPGDATLMNNLGYSYYLGGRMGDAQRKFEEVVAGDPGNQKGWSNLGLILARQGQYPRAVQTMERIMSPSEARYSVGYICLIDGKLPEAERLFKESVRKSTSYNPAAHAALKRVREEQARRARVGDEEDDE